MDKRVEVRLPEAVSNRMEQAVAASGKPADQLIVEAIEFWLSERQGRVLLTQQERALADLVLQGVLRDPTPGEVEGAALWNSLSPAERDVIRQELDRLPGGVSASEIVIANR